MKSYMGVKFKNYTGPIIVEKGCEIRNTTKFGQEVYVNTNVFIGRACREIGAYTSIGSDVIICPPKHPVHSFSTSPVFYAKRRGVVAEDSFNEYESDVSIGPDVWIGTRAIIMQGVKIGVGAVIGAGSIVTKDVDSYSIVVGVPSRHLKYRFSKDVRDKLLESQWWRYKPEENLKKGFPEINSPTEKRPD